MYENMTKNVCHIKVSDLFLLFVYSLLFIVFISLIIVKLHIIENYIIL